MTPQEVLDLVVPRLVKQGEKSFAGSCLYRSQFGACAIGHIIDDDTAKKWDKLPQPDIVAIVNKGFAEEAGYGWMKKQLEFLEQLQLAHDAAKTSSNQFVGDFLGSINIICQKFDLKMPQV